MAEKIIVCLFMLNSTRRLVTFRGTIDASSRRGMDVAGDPIDHHREGTRIRRRDVEESMSCAGQDSNGEVLALLLQRFQDRDRSVGRNRAVGATIEPQSRIAHAVEGGTWVVP